MLFEIGRVAIKTSGRDSNNYCVVIDKLNDNYVLIDGNVRRNKCNTKHLEPLEVVLKIKKGASKEEVTKALNEAEIPMKKSGVIRKKARMKKDEKG